MAKILGLCENAFHQKCLCSDCDLRQFNFFFCIIFIIDTKEMLLIYFQRWRRKKICQVICSEQKFFILFFSYVCQKIGIPETVEILGRYYASNSKLLSFFSVFISTPLSNTYTILWDLVFFRWKLCRTQEFFKLHIYII